MRYYIKCKPASLAHNGRALGSQAGEAKLAEVVKSAGFKHFRIATNTPFNLASCPLAFQL